MQGQLALEPSSLSPIWGDPGGHTGTVVYQPKGGIPVNKRFGRMCAILILAALVVTACGGRSTQPTPVAAPTQPAAPTAAAQPAAPEGATTRPLVPTPPADGSRPLAQLAPAERADRFSGPAPMSLRSDTIYLATIVTAKGHIVAELYGDVPESTNNFVTLARNGFYDGLTFHRVEPGFVIQAGDPLGTGAGGPGYTIPAEIKHGHPRGALAWARTGDQINPERRSSGSQFYITLSETPFLNGAYTVFGYVVEGMEVVDQIAVGDQIIRIEITESQGPSRLPTPTPTPEPKAPAPAEGRPLASLPLEQRHRAYNTAPELVIDLQKRYEATISAEAGEIVIELDPRAAPAAVNSFVVLANLGFYDGMPVAYVEPDAYVIMGSPASQPTSDVGYVLEPEPQPSVTELVTGTVSLYPFLDQASGQMKASGSQFFIFLTTAPSPDVPLSIMGKVVKGLEVAGKLQAGDLITKITITEQEAD